MVNGVSSFLWRWINKQLHFIWISVQKHTHIMNRFPMNIKDTSGNNEQWAFNMVLLVSPARTFCQWFISCLTQWPAKPLTVVTSSLLLTVAPRCTRRTYTLAACPVIPSVLAGICTFSTLGKPLVWKKKNNVLFAKSGNFLEELLY